MSEHCTDKDVSDHLYELAALDEYENAFETSNCQNARMGIRFAKTFGFDIINGEQNGQ